MRQLGFPEMGPVVKNHLIINVLLFIATNVLLSRGIYLTEILSMHMPGAANFHFWQPLTHMFMHGGLWHLAMNMLILWMFGSVLEQIWGSFRFINFYLICGLGAIAIYMGFIYATEMAPAFTALDLFADHPSEKTLLALQKSMITNLGLSAIDYEQTQNLIAFLNNGEASEISKQVSIIVRNARMTILGSTTVIGASGAVAGLFAAYATLFPNTEVRLYFLFPIKVKFLVLAYAAYEFYATFAVNDNVAHMAHLAGMLIGYLLVRFHFNKHSSSMY